MIYAEAVAQIRRYLDRTFADAPMSGRDEAGGKPIGTSFVAPLIVRIAAGIPSLTPVAIMDTPIAQLFQFRKILAVEAGARASEHGAAAGLLAQCLDEANRINAAGTEPAAGPEQAKRGEGSTISSHG